MITEFHKVYTEHIFVSKRNIHISRVGNSNKSLDNIDKERLKVSNMHFDRKVKFSVITAVNVLWHHD